MKQVSHQKPKALEHVSIFAITGRVGTATVKRVRCDDRGTGSERGGGSRVSEKNGRRKRERTAINIHAPAYEPQTRAGLDQTKTAGPEK